MTRDQLIPVFTLMEKWGGGFASRLASAWFHADADNQRRIQEAFPELIAVYVEQERCEANAANQSKHACC